MKNDEAINVFETYLATGHVPYPYELREASRVAISALKGEMPLPEDTVLFNKGVAEGKRLMMEEAVEGRVISNDGISFPVSNEIHRLRLIEGDRVRIIIVKEDSHE